MAETPDASLLISAGSFPAQRLNREIRLTRSLRETHEGGSPAARVDYILPVGEPTVELAGARQRLPLAA